MLQNISDRYGRIQSTAMESQPSPIEKKQDDSAPSPPHCRNSAHYDGGGNVDLSTLITSQYPYLQGDTTTN